jgi:branched-chain amino acid transport system substrate-binding protein
MVKGVKGKRIRFLGVILGSAFIWGIPSISISNSAYKVGVIFTLTGPASVLGEAQRKTVEMIEQWVNGAGGIDGHPLKVLVYDTGGDETKAALVLRELEEKGYRVSAKDGRSKGWTLKPGQIVWNQCVIFVTRLFAESR